VDLGFDPRHVLLVSIDARPPGDAGWRQTVSARLLDRVSAVPGVRSASQSAWPLFSVGGWTNSVLIPGRTPDGFESVHLEVSPGFFATMGMALTDGRDFEARDVPVAAATPSASGPPIIVNEAFVRRYFDGARAVGAVVQRRTASAGGAAPRTTLVSQQVVGVVRDAKYNDPRAEAPPTVYLPLRGLGSLQVRTAGDPLALAGEIRSAIRETDPALEVTSTTLQATLVDNAWLRERLLALISAFFAAAGLLLTAVGLYGTLSYGVVQRRREIGIRVALGATGSSVVGLILTEVGATTLVGAAMGLGGGLFLARFVQTLLFEVRPLDFWSLVLPVLALAVAGTVAAWRPARHAARVDPVIALRAE
jgi:predicted permease